MFKNALITLLLILAIFCGDLYALEKRIDISVDSELEALISGAEIGSVVAGDNTKKTSPTGLSKLMSYFLFSSSSNLEINTEKDIIALNVNRGQM